MRTYEHRSCPASVESNGTETSLQPEAAAEMTTLLQGRGGQIESCRRHLEDLGEGHGSVVLVRGPACTGKSRLVGEMVTLARQRGVTVAACAIGSRAPEGPLQPILSALRACLSTGPPGAGDDRTERQVPSDELSRLRAMLGELTRISPVLVCLDNVQRAAPELVRVLRAVVPDSSAEPVMWVLSGTDVPDSPGFETLTEAMLAAGAAVLNLPPTPGAAKAQEADAGGVVSSPSVAALPRQGDGLPGEPVAPDCTVGDVRGLSLAAGCARPVDGDPPDPPSDWAERALGQVSPRTRLMLEVAAVLGHAFEIADVAKVLRCPVAALVPGVREGLQAGLLVDRGVLTFSHDRTHRAVYQSITPALRRALHTEVALTLLDDRPDAAVAGLSMRDGAAVEALERAAQDVEVAAPRVAARLQLLALAVASAEDRRRPASVLHTVRNLARAGHAAQAQALAAAALSGALPSEVQAQLHLQMATTLLEDGHEEEALQHTTAALGLADVPDWLRSSLLAIRSSAHCALGDAASALVSGRTAVTLARRSDKRLAACQALLAMSEAEQMSGHLVRSLHRASQAVEVAVSGPVEVRGLQPQWSHGRTLMLLDRVKEAWVSFEAGRREEERVGSGGTVTLGHACRASWMLQLGDLEQASTESQAGLTSAEELGTWEPVPQLYAVLAEVATHRGELDRAETLVRRGAVRGSRGTQVGLSLNWATALLEEERGEPGKAWTELAVVLRLLPDRLQGLLADPMAGARLTRLAMKVGDTQGALSALTATERLAALNPGVATIVASAALARGMVHGDAAALQEGVTLLRSSDRPIVRAWACETASVHLTPPWNPLRRSLLEEARAEYEQVGATGSVARVCHELVSVPAPRAPEGTTIQEADWESLTSAELRIVKEVSQGLTNRQVARCLSVSQNTVESHLKHIYPKLGIHSRVQLALMVVTTESRRVLPPRSHRDVRRPVVPWSPASQLPAVVGPTSSRPPDGEETSGRRDAPAGSTRPASR
jgi:DNA-binding CsgD family transcriptional regulator